MEGRAVTREPATLIVLAGGEAKRLGFPKHRIMVDGERVLDRLCRRLGPLFAETVVVGRDIEDLPSDVRVTQDRYAVRSPLVGIHAGLCTSRTDLAFVTACDMPHVEPVLVEFLLGQAEGVDAVVPTVRSYYEPLCAVYRRSCIAPIEDLIERGVLKVSELYDRVNTRKIPEKQVREQDVELRSFVNLNAPEAIGAPDLRRGRGMGA
jgi:molybdopterin-guanine dinucleotide biosynthesis protein A